MTNKAAWATKIATDLHRPTAATRTRRPRSCADVGSFCLMKRERDLDAHEDADSEAPVNVNDAILSFEKELDRMSEAAAPRVKCAAQS